MQSMPDVSPTRWHLAHTTWFFETFLLKSTSGYQAFDDSFEYLFNSYYNAIGQQFPRHRRGQISRPGLSQTLDYRTYVDERVVQLLTSGSTLTPEQETILELGLQHEQQHQELMLTDIKHVLFHNPLYPAYNSASVGSEAGESPCLESSNSSEWLEFPEHVAEIGFQHNEFQHNEFQHNGFSFDNEMPRHRTLLLSHALSKRLVTNAEYVRFIEDGGYRRPELWLSLGWSTVQEQQWDAPLYWLRDAGEWQQYRMDGVHTMDWQAPVCHVSYFEADAYARWSGHRLPTEFEWEAATVANAASNAKASETARYFADQLIAAGQVVHPRAEGPSQSANWLGNVWQWTSSQYTAYPGYQPTSGALGEYNGKFMCNQFVLRGGSCATSSDHIRPTYRNFFPPDARWQFSGIRLAR